MRKLSGVITIYTTMSLFLTLILLQLNLFGGNSASVKGASVSLTETASGKTIGYNYIGHSGKFLFANLDPGNYNLIIEIPDEAIKKVDKRDKEKFDTDIEIAYNIDEKAYCWQHENGYLQISITEEKKLSDLIIPKYERELKKTEESDIPQTGEHSEDNNSSKVTAKQQMQTETGRITILQITVIDTYGTVGGVVESIQQKDFFKLTVGKPDLPLEVLGKVQVLKHTNN